MQGKCHLLVGSVAGYYISQVTWHVILINVYLSSAFAYSSLIAVCVHDEYLLTYFFNWTVYTASPSDWLFLCSVNSVQWEWKWRDSCRTGAIFGEHCCYWTDTVCILVFPTVVSTTAEHSAWSESCACLTPTPTILRGGQSAKFWQKTPRFFSFKTK